MLVPANILPVLSTNTQGVVRTDTIMSGIMELWADGMYFISAIVFAASVLIPLLKLVGLSVLLVAVSRARRRNSRAMTRLHSGMEMIGRWSMLDVFLVAFLAGVVQFGTLATVEPRSGIVAFAAAVVLTVLATDAFDRRMLWNESESETVSPETA
jgi:paraquat-inducible protein A